MTSRRSRRQDRWYTYMVTISPCRLKDYVNPTDLKDLISLLKLKLPGLKTYEPYNYELGSKYRQLHIHFMASHPTMISYRDNCRLNINGAKFFVKWTNGSSKTLLSYCNKESHPIKQSQTLLEHYYRHHYSF